MRSQIPKVFYLSNTADVPEVITLATKHHKNDFFAVKLMLDSPAGAEILLDGLPKEEIKSVYSDVQEGDFVTFGIDHLEQRRSPVHRGIGGVDLLLKEFAAAAKPRAPFPPKGGTPRKPSKSSRKKKKKRKVKKVKKAKADL
mmetsp:Transcript_17319/g.45195  ORF Transcript_17319/g.45195 Transcript_17319/m.45195 type:complete len:142 (+) Transcript_17319:50-475(+)